MSPGLQEAKTHSGSSQCSTQPLSLNFTLNRIKSIVSFHSNKLSIFLALEKTYPEQSWPGMLQPKRSTIIARLNYCKPNTTIFIHS